MDELKVGTITWYDAESGAFIEDLPETPPESPPVQQQQLPPSPTSQIFVPSELLGNMFLRTGELVRYTEKDRIATHIEPLMPSKTTKSYRPRFK